MSDRPVPAPRKNRTNTSGILPSSTGTDPGYESAWYTTPFTPPSLSSSAGSGSHPLKQFSHQTSTPASHTYGGNYQPPARPGISPHLFSRTPPQKKEYSGPQKVVTPQPVSYHDSSESYNPSVTPRKGSQSSSRSSMSSEPSSPFLNEESMLTEIERTKNRKLSLTREVDQLAKQKNELVEEVKDKRQEVDGLKKHCEECEENLEAFRNQESSLRTRIAQCEQSLQLMGKLSPAQLAPSQADDIKELERIVKKREQDMDEKELLLKGRDSEIRRRELELQSEADILFQRKKELDLREYDLKNFSGPPHGSAPVPAGGERQFDIMAHEERERDLQRKEEKLFNKEMSLNKLEAEMRAKKEQLTKWENDVEHEDNRAQQNLNRAKEMMAEANKIKHEALSVSKAAAILDDERKDTKGGGNLSVKQNSTASSSGSSSSNYGATGNNNNAAAGGGTKSGKSATEPDCSDDEMYARFVHMEIMKEMAEKDAVYAQQMSTTPSKPEVMESDAELAFQQQLEIMGIAPGSVDAEMIKKQILEELEKHKKNREASSRDAEIAASITGTE